MTEERFPMTCIICPMGCTMEVTTQKDGSSLSVSKVTDNGCKRGPEYVEKELLNPTRTLTTTITVTSGDLTVVPVKTQGEIPKSMLFQCMEVIRRTSVKAPVNTGDILLYDILGTGINVVSCAKVNKI